MEPPKGRGVERSRKEAGRARPGGRGLARKQPVRQGRGLHGWAGLACRSQPISKPVPAPEVTERLKRAVWRLLEARC